MLLFTHRMSKLHKRTMRYSSRFDYERATSIAGSTAHIGLKRPLKGASTGFFALPPSSGTAIRLKTIHYVVVYWIRQENITFSAYFPP